LVFAATTWDDSNVQAAIAAVLLLAGQFTWPEAREERHGGSSITYTRNLNGQEVPVQQIDEVVVESTKTSRIVDRTTIRYDANGRPGQPETERTELRLDGDTERETRTVTRRDTNGSAYIYEVAQSVTTKSGDDTITKTETQRATLNNGKLEPVQILEIRRSRPSPDTSTQTTITFERNVNKRFVETRRQVVEIRRAANGEMITTDSDYALRGNAGMVLVARKVRRTNGGHTDVDVYEPNVPGRTPTGDAQLVRQQSIDRTTSGGQTVETTTVRTADPDGRLGPPLPADRKVCQGECQ
jgi:hypothetical protein